MPKIRTVAFDIGGVLASRDFNSLTLEEKMIFDIYMSRNKKCIDKKVLEWAKEKMKVIYPSTYVLRPRVIEALDYLKQERIIPSIWTNNIPEIDLWFEQVGLYDYVSPNFICNSFCMGYDKPQKQFFSKALRQIDNEASEVLFIDDSLENVYGARSCGIPASHYLKEDIDKFVFQELKRVRKEK